MMGKVTESCLFKTGISSVIGFGAGGLFGMFMSSMQWDASEEFLKMSTKEQFRHTLRDMRAKSYASAKNLSVVGAVFAGTECVIETVRPRNLFLTLIVSSQK
jgi:import inner membrane translocase subunit TIM22